MGSRFGGYRPRHHKYIRNVDAVEDARDVILRRHQAQGGVETVAQAARVPSNVVEQAAATLVEARQQQHVAEVYAATMPVEAADVAAIKALPATDVMEAKSQAYAITHGTAPPPTVEPQLPPYVPVRPRGVRVAGVATGAQIPTREDVAAFTEAVSRLPHVDPVRGVAVPVAALQTIADVPLPLEPDPTPEPEPTLETLAIGQHDFEYLSGTAGTGKTWLAKKLMELSPKGTMVLAATTGIASVNLGEGTTINALLGFFNTPDLQQKYTSGQLQRTLRRLRNAGLRRILIDEVSMMDGRQLTVIARAVHDVNQPRDRSLENVGTGGDGFDTDDDGNQSQPGDIPPQLGLTIVGDFAQLSPVPDKKPTGKTIPAQYAFESPEWPRFAAHTTKLERVRRQDNQAFVTALHAVRRGDVVSAMRFFTPDRFSPITDPQFNGTTIFAKNADVDRYNELRLDEITAPTMTSTPERWGQQRTDWKQVPDTLTLKETALVMCLANRRDPETKQMLYANGDLGTLVRKVSDTAWKVKLHRNGRVVDVVLQRRENLIPLSGGRKKEIREYEQRIADLSTEKFDLHDQIRTAQNPAGLDDAARAAWQQEQDDRRKRIDEIERELRQPRPVGYISEDGKSEIIGTILYMPLRCAYGATVHKTQGLTLDNVQINIRDGFFKHPGMLFVALSRARTPEGLRIVGDPRGFMERCKVDQRVVPWL